MVDTAKLRDENLNSIAEIMAAKADKEMGILGAAVIGIYQIIKYDEERVHIASITSGEFTTRLSRVPEPDNPKRGQDDKGTDYLAMAQAKKSKRLRTELGQDMGKPDTRRGEDPATGDEALWLAKDVIAVAAFSGAPEIETDRQVAEFGMALLLSFAIDQNDFEGYTQWFESHPNQSNLK